jgi:hypothetical protein
MAEFSWEGTDKKGKGKMADPQKNAPNVTGSNVGGKQEIPRTEGGTVPAKEGTEEDKSKRETETRDFAGKLGGGNIASPSQKESDEASKKLFSKEEEKDGQMTRISALTEEDAKRAEQTVAGLPGATNLTQSLTGTPGQVDLTQSGRLSGDKSLRVQKSVEEINAELEKTAGPNPTPNREGNEFTKAEQQLRAGTFVAIDRDTTGMAEQLKEIREKGSLDEQDKQKLQSMEDRLRETARTT